MPCYPQSADDFKQRVYPSGERDGQQLFPIATSNAKSSYQTFIDSAPWEGNFLGIHILRTDTSSTRYLVDVAFGALGSEQDVIPNLLVEAQAATSYAGMAYARIPIRVMVGERVSMRYQSTSGSATIYCFVELLKIADCEVAGPFSSYGTGTGSTTGSVINPGAVAETYGAYTELTAATTAVIQFGMLMFTITNGAPSSARWAVNLATGALGAETVLIPDLRLTIGGNSEVFGPHWIPLTTYIASGTRIAVNASCSITDATDRVFSAALLGAPVDTQADESFSYAHLVSELMLQSAPPADIAQIVIELMLQADGPGGEKVTMFIGNGGLGGGGTWVD